jgi:uncharacterized protein (DUF1499 family)
MFAKLGFCEYGYVELKGHLDTVMRNLLFNHRSIFICILLGAMPAAAGLSSKHNKFSPCPNSPNCVSSQSDNKSHFVEPLRYAGSLANARQKLINILNSTKRVRLVKAETDFIHAEFRSFIFRFVDDVEFYFPSEETIIHVKSASRTGYYDFGANRRRVERLRATFENSAK